MVDSIGRVFAIWLTMLGDKCRFIIQLIFMLFISKITLRFEINGKFNHFELILEYI